MNITLINPPFLFPSRYEFVLSQCIGLRGLSSLLKSRGHRVDFIDALFLGFHRDRAYAGGYIVGLEIPAIIAAIPEDVELIGISAPFSQIAPVVHDLIHAAKKKYPHAIVVLGGVYPSTQPALALESDADFIVVGEGEIPLVEFLDGKDPKEIVGLYDKAAVGDFRSAKVVERLDDLPFPDYSIPGMDKYFSLSPRMRSGRTAALFTSRGCPFSCEFCSIHPVCGYKYRARSAANVLEEIEYLATHHGIQTLEIEDDNFTLDKRRTIEILEGLIRFNDRQGPHNALNWRTPNGVRIDSLDAEMIGLIKRSNCTEIVLALEHGDPEMLRIMNKKLDLDRAYEVIRCFVENHIKIVLFFIIGYPGETRARFRNALQYLDKIKRLGGDVSICINMAQPYPGTRLLERCRVAGYITDPHYDNFLVRKDLMSTAHNFSLTTPDFNASEIRQRKKIMERRFVPLWKRVLLQILPLLPDGVIHILRKIRGS